MSNHEGDYWIDAWSQGYFGINPNGHIVVKPNRKKPEGDLYELVTSLVDRGIEAPVLIRFNGIVRDRIDTLNKAFSSAIKEFNYRGSYRTAFPIKVNPQRHVVDLIQKYGKKYQNGLEVGSKPELIAALTLEDTKGSLLLCNGYKDAEYIELALMSSKLGRHTIIVIEQLYELKLILEISERLGTLPFIGMRMKLASKGSGRWESSGGENAKFGLTVPEILECTSVLKKAGNIDLLQLLHFHVGSQITSIDAIKNALNEGTRMYVELAKLCPSLSYLDVGGGLAVDYEGTRTTSDSSMNYTLEEYARDVISAIGEACLNEGINDPEIISESGRALVAHHSVLITEVIDVTTSKMSTPVKPPSSKHPTLKTFYSMYKKLTPENSQETLNDAIELKQLALEEFIHGKLNLVERAYSEEIFTRILLKIQAIVKDLPYVPPDLANIDKMLYDTYFCNFSVFQSLPDSWAINQLFPVLPIQRLNEPAKNHAILADLTCDSDGKIDTFISRRGEMKYINLHNYPPGPYYLGIFLVGAYQEILGGLHNLFGDTNVVHVDLDKDGKWDILQVVEGDTIEEVLGYAQYSPQKLIEQLRSIIEKDIKEGRITPQESARMQKQFKHSLESYTYLIV